MGAARMLHVAEGAGNQRQSGGFSFGYFSLATQKKVSRPRVREPASIQTLR